MTEKLQQTIKEEVAKVPKELQEAMGSVDWIKISEEIGKKYVLDEDEINNLQLETLLVLIGGTDPEFYAVNIENQVETTKDTAEKTADEVFEKIFTPIKDALEKNIKKGLSGKSSSAEQTLNFILSGGDYSAFIDQRESQPYDETPAVNKAPSAPIIPPTLADIQAKLNIQR